MVQHNGQVHHSAVYHIADNGQTRSWLGHVYGSHTARHIIAIGSAGWHYAQWQVLLPLGKSVCPTGCIADVQQPDGQHHRAARQCHPAQLWLLHG